MNARFVLTVAAALSLGCGEGTLVEQAVDAHAVAASGRVDAGSTSIPAAGADAGAGTDEVALTSILIAGGHGAATTAGAPVTLPVAYTPADATNKDLDWTVCADTPTWPGGDAPSTQRTCTASASLGSVTSGPPGVGGVYTPPARLAVSPARIRLVACQADICDWTEVEVTDDAPAEVVAIAFFTASPATVQAGGAAALAWSTSRATSLSIAASSGPSPGAVTGTSTTVNPDCSPQPCTVTYTLTAEGAGGPARATAQVSVLAAASSPGARVYPPESTLVQYPQPSASEPALLESITNTFGLLGPAFDTITTRVSDGRHHYAKDSPWNSDESLIMLNDGKILDGRTYAYLRTISRPGEHKTWSNTDPRSIYGATGSAKEWVRVDAITGARTVLATYSQFSHVSYGEYEGNLDNADTGAALVGSHATPFVIDPKTGAVRCTVRSGGGFGVAVSDSTMSQDGAYMLVHWSGYGVDAYRASDCSFVRKLTSSTGHYDACVSQAGEQVIVGEAGSMVRISDGATTQQWSDGSRAHVSCRNIRRPGWVYVSGENGTCDSTLLAMKKFHRIFSVKLDGSQRIESYAWDHQACPSDYDGAPMVAPSPFGDRVWFKARWDGAGSLHSFVARK